MNDKNPWSALKKLFSILPLLILLLTSCAKIDLYEKNTIISKQEWTSGNKQEFTFTLSDTAACYQLFVVLRHTDAYQFNNIWLNISAQIPGDTLQSRNVELSLGSDAKGWEGKGMSDIYEVRKPITQGRPVRFKRAGNYTFTIGQVMRQDPLKHIMSIGLRLEKVTCID